MSEFENRLKIDRDSHNMQRSVSAIMHLLSEFIPNFCRHDASNKLYDAFHKDGIELTNKHMRKEYEAWKELTLDKIEMVNPVYKVPER